MSGLGKTMPLTMAAFTIGGLSLIGVPGTAGFVSKWYLVTALLDASLWPLALLILVASILTLVYVGRVIEVAYFRPVPEGRTRQKVPLTMIVALWIFALSNIYFGLDTEISLGHIITCSKSVNRCDTMSIELLYILILLIPLLTAVGVLLCHKKPNVREAVTLIGGISLFLVVVTLAYNYDFEQPVTLTLLEPFPGLSLALRLEPLGLLFALVAGFLWPVTSLYAIGYMRAHHEKNQTRFYTAFAISIFATMA